MSDPTRRVVFVVELETEASEGVLMDRISEAIHGLDVVQFGGACEVQAASLTAYGCTPSTGVEYVAPSGNGRDYPEPRATVVLGRTKLWREDAP